MAEVSYRRYEVSATQRFVDPEGRLTQKGFELMKAVANLVSSVTIEDGEIKANMIDVVNLEAISAILGNVVVNGSLVVNGTLVTDKLAQNAVSEVTTAVQVGTGRTTDPYLIQTTVPLTSTGNTGVLVSFTAFQRLPAGGSGNNGFWELRLARNGVVIDVTPNIFYDDNFAGWQICSFVDENPGTNPLYEIIPWGLSGLCDFDILGGLGVFTVLKR